MPRWLRNGLLILLANALAVPALDSSDAAGKRKRSTKSAPQIEQRSRDTNPGLIRDDGTPIIMQGYNPPRRGSAPVQVSPDGNAERPVRARRGSSSYVPLPDPRPSGGQPPAAVTGSGPGVYQPPKINSYGDRATGCLHAYPLAIGQPGVTDRDHFVRGCAN